MAAKLSERAYTLLMLIDARSDVDWATGEVLGYWTPSSDRNGEYLEAIRDSVHVSGAGDAAALRGLERRGLTRRPKDAPSARPFAYVITEDGRLAILAHEALRVG